MLGKLKKRKRLRIHGFLRRSSTDTGRNVLKDRRRKGRHQLTVSYPKRYQEVNGKSRLHIIAGGTAKKSSFDGKGNFVITKEQNALRNIKGHNGIEKAKKLVEKK